MAHRRGVVFTGWEGFMERMGKQTLTMEDLILYNMNSLQKE